MKESLGRITGANSCVGVTKRLYDKGMDRLVYVNGMQGCYLFECISFSGMSSISSMWTRENEQVL